MEPPRTLPLFDERATPSSWNERMAPGEFAVHYSRRAGNGTPVCSICSSLPAAEEFAQARVAADAQLRCRIYDHAGFVGAPLREFTGEQYKGEGDLSPRVRRWLGAGFLLVGTVLCLIDWSVDFRLSWPGVVGSRLLIPGALLLVTELLIVLNRRFKGHTLGGRGAA